MNSLEGFNFEYPLFPHAFSLLLFSGFRFSSIVTTTSLAPIVSAYYINNYVMLYTGDYYNTGGKAPKEASIFDLLESPRLVFRPSSTSEVESAHTPLFKQSNLLLFVAEFPLVKLKTLDQTKVPRFVQVRLKVEGADSFCIHYDFGEGRRSLVFPVKDDGHYHTYLLDVRNPLLQLEEPMKGQRGFLAEVQVLSVFAED